MKVFLLVASLVLSVTASAQSDTLQKSKPDSLWHRNPFFRLYPVVMNNQTRLNKGEAQSLLSRLPESFEHYKKYRNRFKLATYSYLGYFLATIISVEGLDNNERKKIGIGLTLSLASLLNAAVFHVLSLSSLKKSIKSFNKHSLNY